MHFLLLNQTFHPDVASTAQHLTDLAVALIERGHQVTVVTSARAYDDPQVRFPPHEAWRGIRIIRLGGTAFGKNARWRRAADFASFLALCATRLACLPRPDVVVALTSPPLISVLGAWVARLRRARFAYWVMDLNPDQAIAAGWLRPDSLAARLLERLSRFSLRRADRIIALDRFMRDRLIAKGAPADRITVLPPWAHDTEVRFDPAGRERFRQAHGLDGKFVVMYSGNHSPCHPLGTLLGAAERLQADPGLVLCFIGGGSEWRRLHQSQVRTPSPNLLCLPYQPLDQLSASLSAADLHVVVMGDPFVGLVHPCKIYNLLNLGAPLLYIGPDVSHITDLAQRVNGQLTCLTARHGDVARVVDHLQRLRAAPRPPLRDPPPIACQFSRAALLPQLIAELESVGADDSPTPMIALDANPPACSVTPMETGTLAKDNRARVLSQLCC